MVAAIGDQESGYTTRDQLESQNGRLVPGKIGPATGFWQFERGGGVRGVMTHRATKNFALYYVDLAGLAFDADDVWRSFTLDTGDELATVFARLLLFTDPMALPPVGPQSEELAFQYYLRNWRPGSWFGHQEGSASRASVRGRWSKSWANALASVYDVDWGEEPGPTSSLDTRSTQLQLVAEIRGKLDELEVLIRDA